MAKYAAYIILTAICGAGIVTLETPANLLLFSIWATVVFIAGVDCVLAPAHEKR